MSLRLSVIVPCLFVSSLLAAELAEKWSKRLESADSNYREAVQKADNIRFYAVQKASAERIRLLKTAMMDATKSGDLDAANEIKAKLTAAESTGGIRPKPKNLTKFGGHEYAIVDQKVTWHVAKRMCEEMGGHLAIVETPLEEQFVLTLAEKEGKLAWIGATDEEVENEWRWIDGTSARLTHVKLDNTDQAEHHLHYAIESHRFNDYFGGARFVVSVDGEDRAGGGRPTASQVSTTAATYARGELRCRVSRRPERPKIDPRFAPSAGLRRDLNSAKGRT